VLLTSSSEKKVTTTAPLAQEAIRDIQPLVPDTRDPRSTLGHFQRASMVLPELHGTDTAQDTESQTSRRELSNNAWHGYDPSIQVLNTSSSDLKETITALLAHLHTLDPIPELEFKTHISIPMPLEKSPLLQVIVIKLQLRLLTTDSATTTRTTRWIADQLTAV
jgi:hypothetical protein